jgi:predicted DNA-binding transcriptional regulator AlpA
MTPYRRFGVGREPSLGGSNLEVPEQLEPLLTAKQVGITLGQHAKTVLDAFYRGDLRGIKLGARTVRFDPADVQDYIDRHRTPVADPLEEEPDLEAASR